MFIWVIILRENMKYRSFKTKKSMNKFCYCFTIWIDFSPSWHSVESLVFHCFLLVFFIHCNLIGEPLYHIFPWYSYNFVRVFMLWNKELFSLFLLQFQFKITIQCSIVFTSYRQYMRLLEVVFRLECSNVV